MIRTKIVAVCVLGLVMSLIASEGWTFGRNTRPLPGLWRLIGVMPAGIPSEEVPTRLEGFQGYWFHRDGTVTLLDDGRWGQTRKHGRWHRRGRAVLIAWNDGIRMVIRIIRAERRTLILAGFDLSPRWFRFTRFF